MSKQFKVTEILSRIVDAENKETVLQKYHQEDIVLSAKDFQSMEITEVIEIQTFTQPHPLIADREMWYTIKNVDTGKFFSAKISCESAGRLVIGLNDIGCTIKLCRD